MVWKNQKIKVMIFAIPTCIKYQQSFCSVFHVLCEVHFEKKKFYDISAIFAMS